MKPIENDILDYMSQWIREDDWCDLNIAIINGETEVAADMLCSSDAINPESCYEYAKPFEKEVVKYANRFRKLSRKKQSKIRHTLFKDVFISDCQDCSHVSFVHDGNETLYPELKTECWQCKSTNIKITRGLK